MAKLPDDSTIVAVVDCCNVSHLVINVSRIYCNALISEKTASDQREDFELEDSLVVELEEVWLDIN